MLLLLPSLIAAAEPSTQRSKPLAPADALRQFVIDDNLSIELVAAEPEVIDPVALRFDEDGRLYVVELRDYPSGPAQGEAPRSRIRLLEDRDNDDRFETSHIFADELLIPTGLQPWQGGVIVTLAGEIAWLKDTDGDGHADVRETWFRGFSKGNEQLRANHPRLALDNQVYVANGLRGGRVMDVRQPTETSAPPEAPAPIELGSRDFVFNPRGGGAGTVAGMSQFGMTFDDYGRRFLCTNRNPLIHVVIEERYASLNPLLAIPSLVQDVAAADEASHVYPLSRAWTTSTLHAGQFTAACGVEIYRGNGMSLDFQGGAFTCEPTANLVHFETVTPLGASFVGKSPYEKREFLASPDEWFRPVALETGPDGALYIADMYRAVIEHPDWMPEELRTRLDLRDGDDRGRIYRIRSKENRPRKLQSLSKLDVVALVHELEHPNSWQRETAQRLLVERQDRTATSHLRSLVRESPSETAKIHALWTLRGLGSLEDISVRAALQDRSPRVREQGVLLSAGWLGDGVQLDHQFSHALKRMALDEDARVRFQIALELGRAVWDEQTEVALTNIALAGLNDRWTRLAVAISAGDHAERLLQRAMRETTAAQEVDEHHRQAWISELAELVGAKNDAIQCARVFLWITQRDSDPNSAVPPATKAAINGLRRGVERRGNKFPALLAGDGEEFTQARFALKALLSKCTAELADAATSREDQLSSIELLRLASDDDAPSVLLPVFDSTTDQSLKLATIDALAGHESPAIAVALLDRLPAASPSIRRAILSALVASTEWAQKLLDQVDGKQFAVAELGPTLTTQLLASRDPMLRERAKTLSTVPAPDLAEVRRKYANVLTLAADPARGQKIFEKHCATCHRIGQTGVDVGPDIADSRTKTLEQLLTDILEPNRAIDANYVGYLVVTNDGLTLNGILASDSGSSITLRQAENKVVSLLRSDISELRATGLSLMPEGWDRTIPPQEMADLISFIKNWRYLDGLTPLENAKSGK